jgi:phage terminase Nu1 subunit (DNA packaging protein)
VNNRAFDTAKAAQIYRQAARHLEAAEDGTDVGDYYSPYACDRIGQACGWYPRADSPGAQKKFVELRNRFMSVFCEYEDNGQVLFGRHEPENQDARIIALCLIAAMVEAGDAP